RGRTMATLRTAAASGRVARSFMCVRAVWRSGRSGGVLVCSHHEASLSVGAPKVTDQSVMGQQVHHVAMTSLVLASASPARLMLLHASGIEPAVVVSDIDEQAVEAAARAEDPHLSPERLAQALAEAKGTAVRERLPGDERLVLACDSVLEVDGRIHGKPGTVEVARRRWREELRGRSGVLHTGH